MDFIELDVQSSRDGELFVLHDDQLDRTMQASGKLSQKMSSYLATVRSKEFDTFLPSFQKTLEHYIPLKPHLIKFMVELKGKNTGKKAAVLINRLKVHDRIVFSGRHIAELKTAYHEAPTVPLCLNITSCRDFTLQKFLKTRTDKDIPLPFTMISLRASEITKEFIQHCHHFGILALAWDFLKIETPYALMHQLIEYGIDGILFDDPETVRDVRDNIKKTENKN